MLLNDVLFLCKTFFSFDFYFCRDESTHYAHLTPAESANLREASESTPESVSTSDESIEPAEPATLASVESVTAEHNTNVVSDRADAYMST